ncbi:DMT family transporter [Paenibacillus alba]|uniref:DMT family transporter n=1 Tax=Paenibacillus alba TaxID=1197127 RepID=A0ABU6GA64_9BACL|nr:DMT family transporter [Paenibacillus alba]MEC0231041.1 DMT family transporter [Paenibacillus alba]
MTINSQSNTRGILFAILSVALTAIWYPAIKIGLKEISPIQAAAIETLVSLITAIVVLKLSKQKFTTSKLKPLIVISVINAFATICLYLSLYLLDPVMSSLLGRNYVLFALMISFFFLKEKVSIAQWVLMLVSVAGGFLFVYSEVRDFNLIGILFVLGNTLFFAIGNAISKKYCSSVNPSVTLFYIKLISLLPIILIGTSIDNFRFFKVTPYEFIFIAVVSIVSSFLGVKFFYKALAVSSFAYVNTIRSMGPIFVFVYSLPFFPIDLSLLNAVGGVSVVICIALLSYVDYRKSKIQPKNSLPINSKEIKGISKEY